MGWRLCLSLPFREEARQVPQFIAGEIGGETGRHDGPGILAGFDITAGDDLELLAGGITNDEPQLVLALHEAAHHAAVFGGQAGGDEALLQLSFRPHDRFDDEFDGQAGAHRAEVRANVLPAEIDDVAHGAGQGVAVVDFRSSFRVARGLHLGSELPDELLAVGRNADGAGRGPGPQDQFQLGRVAPRRTQGVTDGGGQGGLQGLPLQGLGESRRAGLVLEEGRDDSPDLIVVGSLAEQLGGNRGAAVVRREGAESRVANQRFRILARDGLDEFKRRPAAHPAQRLDGGDPHPGRLLNIGNTGLDPAKDVRFPRGIRPPEGHQVDPGDPHLGIVVLQQVHEKLGGVGGRARWLAMHESIENGAVFPGSFQDFVNDLGIHEGQHRKEGIPGFAREGRILQPGPGRRDRIRSGTEIEQVGKVAGTSDSETARPQGRNPLSLPGVQGLNERRVEKAVHRLVEGAQCHRGGLGRRQIAGRHHRFEADPGVRVGDRLF